MVLFVPVREPGEVRKELLVSSKTLLGALRRYEHYRELRKQKLAAFHELAEIWTDLARMQRKLKSALPKTDIRVQQKPIPAPAHKQAVQKATVREQKSKMQLLEEQLARVEGRLQGLK